MHKIDSSEIANRKNRVRKSRLETELKRIEREQIIEMRMHKNAKQRFKNKYSKLDVFDESRGSEPSDVVMYETHYPGFCYRRNGECRLQQSMITSSSVEMKDLHMLLFTNGEVDIEKLLCLYLLVVHKTEMLTPPPKSQRTSFLSREQSPLERLIERSKRRAFVNKLRKDIPLYILAMHKIDSSEIANRKNRVRKSRLETELKRIEREQIIEMRMHKNAKQRFKNKYSKLDVFDESRGSEPSDVVMYETHYPGFCYRRNGECRLQQSMITSSSVEMKDLHMLLFTNGEVDIEKLLCLYLLVVHKTEMLTPPPKSQRTSFLSREQSPLERLIERSKRRAFVNKLRKDIPLYILDESIGPKGEKLQDARVQSKIIINNKILQIIHSVKMALEVSNPALLSKFLTAANNKDIIQVIMSKPKIINFCTTLHGQNVISSCESFHLEVTKKEDLVTLEINVDALKNLLSNIRRNILLMTHTDRWRAFEKAAENVTNITSFEKEKEIQIEATSSSSQSSQHLKPREINSIMEPIFEIDEFFIDLGKEESSIRLQPSIQSKIVKNMQKGFSDIEFENRISNQEMPTMERLKLDVLANLLNQKVRREAKREYRIKRKKSKISSTPSAQESLTSDSTISSKTSGKVVLKQTLCDACLQKWKNPLPSPKLPKLKKLPLPTLKDTSYFSSRSAQRISDMISDEIKNYQSLNQPTKLEPVELSNKVYEKLAKGNYLAGNSIEIVDLDDMDLAKIRQEIRENETKKKFQQFMKNA